MFQDNTRGTRGKTDYCRLIVDKAGPSVGSTGCCPEIPRSVGACMSLLPLYKVWGMKCFMLSFLGQVRFGVGRGYRWEHLVGSHR